MQKLQVLHRQKNGGKPRVPAMQKIDASVTPIQWPVSLGVAPKAEGPLTTKPGHSEPTRIRFCIKRCHDFDGFEPDADLVSFASSVPASAGRQSALC
jgi:hypothetical protein